MAFLDFTRHQPGFLNDIAVGPDGNPYVTDTGRARVYRVTRNQGSDQTAGAESTVEVAIEDPLTGPPNGITWDEGRGAFLLAPWGGGKDSTIWVVDGGVPRAAARVDGAPAEIGVDTRRGRVAVPYIALDRVEIWMVPGIGAGR